MDGNMSKRTRLILIFIFIIILLGAGGYFFWQYSMAEPVYTGYTVVSSTDRADSSGAFYAKYGEGFLRYSRDGIAYYNSENIAQWNASYELQSPVLDIREDYCAVAGIGSSWIYVFNKEGAVMSVDTTLPIVTISVSAGGCVAVVLEDGNTQYIDMYDTAGEKAYRIKTSIQGKGVPTDISISDDGVKLMVAYTNMENGQLRTSIAFYNFGEVGKNESERLVGGFDQYDGMLIPMVQFVRADTAVAVSTGKISIYTINQFPKLVTDIIIDGEMHGVFLSEQYIGIVCVNHEPGYPYVINVYDMKGNLEADCYIETDYRHYDFIGHNIMMYDDNDVCLVNLKGEERFRYTFDIAIDSLIPITGDDVYVYINSRKVQKIKLVE